MIIVVNGQKLEAFLSNPAADNGLDVTVHFSDHAANTVGFLRAQRTVITSSAGAVEVCASPASGVVRLVSYISVTSKDSAPTVFNLRYDTGGDLKVAPLDVGEQAEYTNDGWHTNTANGSRKSGAVQDLSGFQTTAGFADDETPGGVIDGANTVFTLVNAPSPAASLQLHRNGVLQKRGIDYTLTTDTITYATAPSIGDTHDCSYRH